MVTRRASSVTRFLQLPLAIDELQEVLGAYRSGESGGRACAHHTLQPNVASAVHARAASRERECSVSAPPHQECRRDTSCSYGVRTYLCHIQNTYYRDAQLLRNRGLRLPTGAREANGFCPELGRIWRMSIRHRGCFRGVLHSMPTGVHSTGSTSRGNVGAAAPVAGTPNRPRHSAVAQSRAPRLHG